MAGKALAAVSCMALCIALAQAEDHRISIVDGPDAKLHAMVTSARAVFDFRAGGR